jgi:hypothetical protein
LHVASGAALGPHLAHGDHLMARSYHFY